MIFAVSNARSLDMKYMHVEMTLVLKTDAISSASSTPFFS